jgi:hypothetical protein
MSKCELCGLDAGFLSKRHKECQAKYNAGVARITEMGRRAALEAGDLDDFQATSALIAKDSFIDEGTLRSLVIASWGKAARSALEDGILSREEEKALVAYRDHFQITQEVLDRDGSYITIVKAGIIRDILEGKIPQRAEIVGQLPFNLQKAEIVIWPFPNTAYLEQRTRTTHEGSYQGVSIRVAKGLYYRTGGFSGNPVITSQMVNVATGCLGITQKHIYFSGGSKAFRVPYTKIVAFRPYSDGIGILRDAATARLQVFITGDGWFTYNLVTNLAKMAAA